MHSTRDTDSTGAHIYATNAPRGGCARSPHSPRASAVVLLSLLVTCAVFAGCGGSGTTTTAAEKLPLIRFASPSIAAGNAIPVRSTCDGTDSTPSFVWGAVPHNTAELALFLFNIGRSTPAANGTVTAQVRLLWAVAGLSPKLHGIPAGKLPHGAITTHKRYSICPPRGKVSTYLFQILALSHRFPVKPGFDAGKLLHQFRRPEVLGSGSFTTAYKRA